MSETRCVIDTNVLISAVLNDRGLPARVVAHVIETGWLLASDATLFELRSRVSQPRKRHSHSFKNSSKWPFGTPLFDPYQSPEGRERFVGFIESRSRRVVTESVVTDSADPDDNPFLVLALDGRADVIVSGDKKCSMSTCCRCTPGVESRS